MVKKKIVYIVTEMDPFLQSSSLARIGRQLVGGGVRAGYEVRVIMPKFGGINQRSHSLYEVQRLCGINVAIDGGHMSLIAKVGTIQEDRVRLQVYFIDNEELFHGKKVFRDKDGNFYPSNGTRIGFMSKAAFVMLENLGWSPDIIHCMGWAWSFVPVYGKVVYANRFLFKKSKFLFTYGPDHFTGSLGESFLSSVQLRKVTPDYIKEIGGGATFEEMMALTKEHADRVTCSFDETHAPSSAIMDKHQIRHIANDDDLIANYHRLYDELLAEPPAPKV